MVSSLDFEVVMAVIEKGKTKDGEIHYRVKIRQIMFGKESYQSSRRDLPDFNFYDVSDDEN